MGTWDYKPLDNDLAADLAAEFNEEKDAAVLSDPIQRAAMKPEGAYIDSPDCEEAVAAAYLLTTEFTDKSEHLDLRNQAKIALTRVLDNSELKELWHESEEYSQWEDSVKALIKDL